MLDLLQHIDERMFLFLNGLNSPFFDKVMFGISGKITWLPLYLFLIFWMIYRKRTRGLWLVLFTIMVFSATDSSSVHFFKNVFERLRPCHNPDLKELVHLVNGHCGGKFGFISNHASNTFGMAVFVSLALKERWLSVSLLVWAGIVSYSRIYLGVHYPFDILAGALWGGVVAWGIYELYTLLYSLIRRRSGPHNNKMQS